MTSLAIYLVPVAIYSIVVGLVERASGKEIAGRLGLTLGERNYYLGAVGLGIATSVLPFLILRTVPAEVLDHENLALSRFVGQTLTGSSLLSALRFGVLETGLGEEFFFRGLIAGVLGRRMRLWVANAVQAAIFVVPHVLLMTVDGRMWPQALLAPFVSGLVLGWLRLRSGSIFPGCIMHALGNVIAAIAVMTRA